MNSRREKIIYILPFYDRNTDTHLRYNYKLIDAASKELDMFVIVEKAQNLSNVSKVRLLTRLTNWRLQRFQNPILRFLELLFLCLRLRASGYKKVYVHYSYYGALAGIFAGLTVFYWNRGMPWLFKRGFFEEAIFRFILRHAVLVTSPRELAEEYKTRYGATRYRVLSNWIDLKEFSPRGSKEEAKREIGLDPAKKIVLFVHHLSPRKGADLIAKTAAQFSDSENIEFVVAGEGPYRAKFEEEAGCSSVHIKVLGDVPHVKIPGYFRAADIFFMPSREEGSPHVILEAMAAGTPFVAADVGGIREIIPKEAEELLCPSENVEAFAVKIKQLLRDAPRYALVRGAGLRHAQNFSLERGVKEFIALFE